MRYLRHILLGFISLGLLGLIAGVAGVSMIFAYYGKDLPNYEQLKDYTPPIVTRLYAGDGSLMHEYAREKRVFVPIDQIPEMVKNAFIATEDQNFYYHEGVDLFAVMRAAVVYARAKMGQNVDIIGGSTITQQVIKNFLLTNERSFERKFKEAILAYRMEKALSKDRILELYLNQIYFGGGSYGVATAALDYFNKSLEQLTVAETAYLAGLPKAPNNYHPIRNQDAAFERRAYVIDRMEAEGYITAEQANEAKTEPMRIADRLTADRIGAPYFSEEVRRALETQYGEDKLYGGGLAVHTSVDPHLQKLAVTALRNGLMAYDKRQKGWRGAPANLGSGDLLNKLRNYKSEDAIPENWQWAIVSVVRNSSADVLLRSGSTIKLEQNGVEWTGKSNLTSILNVGDVIPVERIEPEAVETEGEEATKAAPAYYQLQQIPNVRGAIVALDPHTGRVLAMHGGWVFGKDQFNRATQAKRQPGSAFKPLVYLTALEKGFTPATLVLDAPFVIYDDLGRRWSPSNYSGEYYGPTPLRVGIEKSRNLMTVRLANYVGMKAIGKTAERFGVADDMPLFLPNALGAWETTLLNMATAYGVLVNGGYRIEPSFVDRIQDRYGKTIYRHDERDCPDCGNMIRWAGQSVPELPSGRTQILDERIAHQMVSIMEGTVQRGTAVRLKELAWPLAGKTGTTNESKDAWFIGFSPDLVAGVYIGYDEPKTLGKKQTGSNVALPVFKEFIEGALKDTPPTPFRVPKGIRLVRIDADDGTLAEAGDEHVIWESFLAGTAPGQHVFLLDADGRIKKLPSVLYYDNYVTMTDQFVPGENGQDTIYTDRNTGKPRVGAATTGTGGIY